MLLNLYELLFTDWHNKFVFPSKKLSALTFSHQSKSSSIHVQLKLATFERGKLQKKNKNHVNICLIFYFQLFLNLNGVLAFSEKKKLYTAENDFVTILFIR